MRTFRFVVETRITMVTEVQAESLEDAIEKATEAGVQGLCHHCASKDADGEWVTTGELDCVPCESPLVEVAVDDEHLTGADLERAQGAWGA